MWSVRTRPPSRPCASRTSTSREPRRGTEAAIRPRSHRDRVGHTPCPALADVYRARAVWRRDESLRVDVRFGSDRYSKWGVGVPRAVPSKRDPPRPASPLSLLHSPPKDKRACKATAVLYFNVEIKIRDILASSPVFHFNVEIKIRNIIASSPFLLFQR